jgi:hypothetical protein
LVPAIRETHRDYTHRLLWFLRTDAAVPESIRQNLQQWGLPKDEFTHNGHWPCDLTPKAAECDNLLVTCALGSSRVAFNSLRVEPTWMMLGQAAGIAAAMTQKDKTTVQSVNVADLQRRLHEAGVPFRKP